MNIISEMRYPLGLLVAMRILFLLEEQEVPQCDRAHLAAIRNVLSSMYQALGKLMLASQDSSPVLERLVSTALDEAELDRVVVHLLAVCQGKPCECSFCRQIRATPIHTSIELGLPLDLAFDRQARGMERLEQMRMLDESQIRLMPYDLAIKVTDGEEYVCRGVKHDVVIERGTQPRDALSQHIEQCYQCSPESLCEEGKRIQRQLWGQE